MLSRIRKRFTFANVMLTLALVFAMTGGAYAAKKYLITSTKQISPKVLKELKGKTGPAGSAGPEGKAGAPGTNGKDGINGTNGKDGTNGESVAASEVKTGEASCEKRGGSKFTVGGKETYACNGKEGEPWTAGGTLPSEKTETGSWVVTSNTSENIGPIQTAISFPIPLKVALGETKVHYIAGETASGKGELEANSSTVKKVEASSGTFMPGQEISGTGIPPGTLILEYNSGAETIKLSANATVTGTEVALSAGPSPTDTAACPGTAVAPKAVKGNLCVYATAENNIAPAVKAPAYPIKLPSSPSAFAAGADTSGALIIFGPAGSASRSAYGTWAVTAP